MTKKYLNQTGSAHVVGIIILAVILIGALGYVFWQNFAKNDQGKTTKETTTRDEATPAPSPAPAEKEAGKKYQGDTFSFSYPNTNWVVGQDDQGAVTVATSDYKPFGMGIESGAIITVYVSNSQSKDIDAEYTRLQGDAAKFGFESIAKTTINGQPAITYHSNYEGARYHTVFIKDGQQYDVVYRYADNTDASLHMDDYTLVTSSFAFER